MESEAEYQGGRRVIDRPGGLSSVGPLWLSSVPSPAAISTTPKHQRGVAIFAVVFLLILFGTIGVFMARTSGVQNMSTALSVRTMQASFAARSGLEWGIRQATASQASHDTICDSGGTINTAFTLTGGAANGYQVDLVCDDSGGYQEAGVNFEVDLITVNARRGNPGDLTFVTRTLQAVITTGRALPP